MRHPPRAGSYQGESTTMDATRSRRTRDQARQGWYARYRQWRFARYLGFAASPEALKPRRPAIDGR